MLTISSLLLVSLLLSSRCFRVVPKAPEPKINLAAIRTAEESYFQEFGRYVAASPVPEFPPTSRRLAWPLEHDRSHGFNTLGWRPEGPVRCQYAVAVDGVAFTAEARCIPPGGGDVVTWGYVKALPDRAHGIEGPLGYCSSAGVFNPRDPARPDLHTVGPCNAASVQPRF